MSRLIKFILLFLFLGCSDRSELELVGYSVDDCDARESTEELSKLKNRITDYYHRSDTTIIEVFFIENCGYVVDPKVSLNYNNLFIEVDQFYKDSTRLSLLCTCCYTVRIKILGIEKKAIDELNFFIQLSDTHPEKIALTDSIYYTYQIDYIDIESETIFYPQEDNIYTKRIYENENEKGYYYSYFPDNGHLYLDKMDYQQGTCLRIHNDFYYLRDTLSRVTEKGKVNYHILEGGVGVKVILSEI